MIVNFYPWEIDVDIEATKRFYEENDCSEDKVVNQWFYAAMTQKQKDFFASLGVEIDKVKAAERVHEIPDEEELPGGKIFIRTLDFLLCGDFLAIPDYQAHICGEEDLTGMKLPDALKIITMPEGEKLPTYNIDGWNCVFKHPIFHMDESKFEKWDCGFVMGSILMMGDM